MNNFSGYSGSDRRKYKRINKNFILTYYVKSDPSHIHEITQLKNIGLGGMCFVATNQLPRSTIVAIELKTPYVSTTTHLEGEVLEAKERVKDLIYEIRIRFTQKNPDIDFLLIKLIDFFSHEKSSDENN